MRLIILLLAVSLLPAADLDLGLRVFRTSCAVGYCHGSGGSAGRAPKLTGRQFEHAFVLKITRDGVPNTGMPGWKDRLNPAELESVVAYVTNISGGVVPATPTGAATQQQEMPAAAKRGRDLFTDALRGVYRCNTCHALEGIGTPVGPNLASGGPSNTAAIRAGKPGTVRLATSGGDSFPALVAEQGDWVKVFDLTSPPPVLRTFAKGEISFSSGSSWQHSSAVKNYSDSELSAVEAYLQWLANR